MIVTRLMPLTLIKTFLVQTVELANAPASTSTKTVKSSTKPKKIWKKFVRTLMLYMPSSRWNGRRKKLLIIMIQKMNCPLKYLLQITHITPTIRNCLVMMKKDNPDLVENWFSYLSGLHNGQNATIFSLVKSQLLYCSQKMLLLMIPNDYGHFVTFGTKYQNSKDWFFELKFWAPVDLSWKVKSYYSLLLFTGIVHCYCTLLLFITFFLPI